VEMFALYPLTVDTFQTVSSHSIMYFVPNRVSRGHTFNVFPIFPKMS